MTTTFIYALCEPGTRTVRYIGKADDPKKRFKNHLRYSVKKKSYLGHWLSAVESRGEKPTLIVLREVPYDQWEVAEERYIRLARGCGIKLVNSTDGGGGLKLTPEIRVAISVALTGRKLAPAHREAISASLSGREHASEHNAKVSAALMGDKHFRFGMTGPKSTSFGTKHPGSSSSYLGVSWDKTEKRWRATITVAGKLINLGRFAKESDAAKAFDARSILIYGADAKLNFPII